MRKDILTAGFVIRGGQKTLDDALQAAVGEAVELADQRFGRGEHVCADPAQQKAGDAQPVYADDKILIGLAEPVKAGLRGKKAVQQGRKQLENLAFQRVAL